MAAELETLPLVLTVQELAEHARVSPSHIYELVRLGQVRAVHLGRVVRIPRHEALRYLGVDQEENGDGRGS